MNMNTNMNRINNEINEMEQRFEKKKTNDDATNGISSNANKRDAL